MPDEVLGQRDQITGGESIAPVPALFDVGSGDGQNIAVPLAGGKSHPRVSRVLGRMWTSIHVDGAGLLIGADVVLDGDESVRLRISFLPDAQLQRAPVNIGGGV